MSCPVRSLVRPLAFAALVAQAWAPAQAQLQPQPQVRPLTQILRAAPYDVAKQAFLQDDAQEGGLGSSLLFDNSDDSTQYVTYGVNEVLMDWGRLTAFGENAITQMVICYGTSNTNPVDVTVRLHSGLEDASDPGAGLELPLTGLPGSPDGEGVGWLIPVVLPAPVFLPDGPLRYSLQGNDSVTGPVLVDANPALELSNTLQFFSLKGVANPELDFGSNGDPASIFLQLLGLPHGYDHTDQVQAPLSGRDLYHGWLASAEDEQTFWVDVLPDEALTATLTADKGSDLAPTLTVSRVVGGEVLASASSAKKKVALKKLVVPGGGAIAITVGSAGGSGGYRLKLASKVDKSSRKPEVDTSGQLLGGLLSSFVAEPCSLLTAKVFPSPKSKQLAPRPVLAGPMGEFGSEAWFRKGSTWQLKQLPLPTHGTYTLRAGTVAEGGGEGEVDLPVSAKLSIKQAKAAVNKGDAFADELAGQWVQDEFITEVNRYTGRFVGGKGGGGALTDKQPNPEGSLVQPTITLTSQLGEWEVHAVDAAPDGERRLQYRIDAVDVSPPLFTQAAPQIVFERRYEHPGGDPAVMRFLGEAGELAEIWRRDTVSGPAAPLVEAEVIEALDPGGPSQHILNIAYHPSFKKLNVFKASAGSEIPPARPFAEIEPCPFGPAGAQVLLFNALSSTDGGPASYWVVAYDDEGRQSVPSDVATVF